MKWSSSLSPLLSLALAAGCAPKGTFDGKLVDPLTGKPRAGVELLAKTADAANLECMELPATTDEQGAFHIEGLCVNANYHLEVKDPTLALEGPESIPGGVEATEVVEVKAWRAPKDKGVYLLKNDELQKQRSLVFVGKSKIWKSDEEVLYPEKLPTKVPVVDGGFLVLSGAKWVDRAQLLPLIPSGRRRFGDPKNPEPSEPWWYIGVEFETDTKYERKTATPREDRVWNLDKDGRHLRYIAGDALPTGHYVLFEPGKDKRLFMFNFGEEIKAPGAE